MAECPPGVHSMFDFCPGDCTEPVEDEHELHRIGLWQSVTGTLQWLRRFHATVRPPAQWTLSTRIYAVQQPDQEELRFETGDTLCWDGTRVWLHSSHLQEVETCEAKEAAMLQKFGTGQITTVEDGTEESLSPRVGREMSPEDWAQIVQECREELEEL